MSDIRPPKPLATRELAWVFLRLGALGFGGLGAVLALLTRELVERRKWLTQENVTEALTYTKLLPGSTVVQVVAYLGWKLGRWPGAIVAAVAFLLPAFAVMLTLAAGYRALPALTGLSSMLRGLTAAVVGLLIVTMGTLARKNVVGWGGAIVAVIVFAASAQWGVNPALLVVTAGLVGVLGEARRGRHDA